MSGASDPDKTQRQVELAREGDRSAYDDLFARASARLLLFIRVRLGPALAGNLEPMDILQETYSRAHRSFADFIPAGEGSFVRWLCRLAENQMRDCADHFAAAKRRPPGKALPVSEVLAKAEATGTGPATAFDRARVRERLAGALETLTEDERRAILLRFFEGLSIDEMAASLDKSPSGVRRLLGRAANRLGMLLAHLETNGVP